MSSIYDPFDSGKRRVKTFRLEDPTDNENYTRILNDDLCVIEKEEFTYAGRMKDDPVVTVWYVDEN